MFSIKTESKITKLAILIILIIYLALCFASFAFHKDSTLLGSFEKFDNDDVKYLRSAWTLLETGRYTYNYVDQDTVFIMPGLTTVLAGFVIVFGKYPILPFKIFQALLGCACLYLIFMCGRKMFNSRIGVIAAGIMAIYAPSIYVVNTLLTETIFYFLFLLTFLSTIYAIDTYKMKYYIWGGAFLGLSALFRPAILLYPIAVLIMWIIKRYKFIDMIKYGAVVIGVVCAILSPWIIRNAIVFNDFIPLTKASGNPALQGAFINYDQSVKDFENIDYYNIIKKDYDIDIDNYGNNEIINNDVELAMLKIRFKEIILKDPLKYLKWYTLGKTGINWSEPFIWTNLFNISYKNLVTQHYTLLFFGVLGFIMLFFNLKNTTLNKGKGLIWFPAVAVVYFNCAHLPFFCMSRYMFPVMFCFGVFSAYLIESLIKYMNWVKDIQLKNKKYEASVNGKIKYTNLRR